jgi:GGDEF domain-containing protein/CHASE3 domain sensor protein
MKLTISRKLLFSYLAMAVLTVLASAYALFSLQQLDRLSHVIIHEDVFMVDLSKQMIDTVLDQESAEKKYLILKDPSIAEIFWNRSREFRRRIESWERKQNGTDGKRRREVLGLHERYDALFRTEEALVGANRLEEAVSLSGREGQPLVTGMVEVLRSLQRESNRDITGRLARMKSQAVRAGRMTLLLSGFSLLVGLLIAVLITTNISRPLKRLEQATDRVADGEFDYDLRIDRKDEIGSLAYAFSDMMKRLKVMEEYNLDASPLTGLPGNRAIEKEIEKRLAARTAFSLCHVDLDNFKPFADHYGYAWGSEVIKEVARIMSEYEALHSDEKNFIGHIGGDDFILMARPDRVEAACRHLVGEFDRRMPKFYSEKDRQYGFIAAKDRKGVQQKYPMLSVTIAIVTDDGTRFKDPLEMARVAAALKEYAKALPGSNYVRLEDVEAGVKGPAPGVTT